MWFTKNKPEYFIGRRELNRTILLFGLLAGTFFSFGQKSLTLSQAMETGINNYQGIQAKRSYLNASTLLVQDVKNQYLPNLIASIQQDYGTVNGQFGPLLGFGGLGVASSGPVNTSQNWDAAFGALYLINTNWEFFTFGRTRSRIQLAGAAVKKDSASLQQEIFVQQVKIAGAYLNLLAAQKFVQNADANLQRAIAVQQVILARTKTGLNAGVDSSIANAEVSKAKLSLIDAKNITDQFSNQLAQLLNMVPGQFTLDSTFFEKIPAEYNTTYSVEQNPQVKFYQARIDESVVAADYLKKSILPGLNLFGIYQTRGSGFGANYNAANNYPYSKNYFDGIKPVLNNYVAGIAVAWNIASPYKIKQQVKAQRFVTEAYRNEYDLISTQLKDQLLLADSRIQNSLESVKEVPLQYKASADAFMQKTVLFKNGLTNIVEVQLALYALNKAETDKCIAYINVWQALLLKAAASGDIDLFRKQVK